MNIRTAFISNSSSSSFIIYRKSDLPEEELIEKSEKRAMENHGEWCLSNKPNCLLERKTGEEYIGEIHIEYGSELAAKELFNLMNIDEEFRFRWSE